MLQTDDIVIYLQVGIDHIKQLEEMFQRLHHYHLTLNHSGFLKPAKCQSYWDIWSVWKSSGWIPTKLTESQPLQKWRSQILQLPWRGQLLQVMHQGLYLYFGPATLTGGAPSSRKLWQATQSWLTPRRISTDRIVTSVAVEQYCDTSDYMISAIYELGGQAKGLLVQANVP